jgi:hypothetical protein
MSTKPHLVSIDRRLLQRCCLLVERVLAAQGEQAEQETIELQHELAAAALGSQRKKQKRITR